MADNGPDQAQWVAQVVTTLKHDLTVVDEIGPRLWDVYRKTSFEPIQERLLPIIEQLAALHVYLSAKIVEWEKVRDGKMPRPEDLYGQ